MKLSTLLYVLPLFTSLLASKPDLPKRDAITAPYYLKTKTINGGDNTKDGLYVWAYRTGIAFPLTPNPRCEWILASRTDSPQVLASTKQS
jgi:hypothetical protein